MKDFRQYLTAPLAIALIFAGIGATIALSVRFFLIEVHQIGQLCDPGNGPWWCMPRQATYQAFRIWQPIGVGALGVAALIAGAASLIEHKRWGQYAAACLGAIGCVLYNADLAAPGLVLALVAAARTRPLVPKV
jgi:hypothetical protein